MTSTEVPTTTSDHPVGDSPAPGFYPVPAHDDHHQHPGHHGHHGHHGLPVVERRWDGEVWNDWTRPAPEGTTLAPHRRHPLAFLRSPGWILLATYVVATASCMALVARDPHATRPSGIVWLLPVLGLVSATSVMTAVVLYFQRRLRFDQVAERPAIVAWGVLSGIVGIGVALLGEVVLPRVLGANPDDHVWIWIAGPAEETGSCSSRSCCGRWVATGSRARGSCSSSAPPPASG